MMDAEVWLIATPHEAAVILAALRSVGRAEGASKPEPLSGNDSGRVRRYLRLRIPYQATGNRPQPKAAGADSLPLTLANAAYPSTVEGANA